MKINYKKILIIIFVIISMIVVYKLPKLLINKYNEPLPEVRLREIKSSKAFAIMVQNGDNYEEYKSNDNAWPGAEYEFKEAKCIDNNGELVENVITFESATTTVILETDKTVSCTLYFNKSTLGKLRENEKLANKDNLSSDLQGGMYRYQGTDDVRNWICFGTTDNCGTSDTLIDKYMYRIIGITEEGELYLIKEVFLKEENITGFTWNDKYETSGSYEYTCDSKICPEWNTSLLFKRINGASNGNIKGSGNYIDKANTDIFVDSSEYDYLQSGDKDGVYGGDKPSEWYNLIADHKWMCGDIGDYTPFNTCNGRTLYEIENGNANVNHYVGIDGNNEWQPYRWTEKADGKISIMYVSDYYYSYYDGVDENSRGNAGNYSNLKNSWLFFQKDNYNPTSSSEWFSTRWGVYNTSSSDVAARILSNEGTMSNAILPNLGGVRPVFYLSSKVKIASGNGTKANPFILEIN